MSCKGLFHGLICTALLFQCCAAVPYVVQNRELGTVSPNILRKGGTFTIMDDSFFLDGQKFQVVSAELHYFRIPPPLWRDRMKRVAAMGFNAIQVYVPWNFHEQKKGEISFQGDRDLGRFLRLAQELNLLVLLRPGPYICAEWEFGGFPAWLLASKDIRLRTFESTYIKHVTEWFDVLLPYVEGFLYAGAGPVVMVQVENEFGSYGHVSDNEDDRAYMLYLIKLLRKHLGKDVVLYTTDFGDLGAMQRGSINGSQVLTAGDFGPGSNYTASAAAQKQMNPPGLAPPFCSEFYSGWFTKWGEDHMANKTGAQAEKDLAGMLALGFSVSVYMGHGGTNFEFWGGANTLKAGDPESYVSLVTSYDYSAPVTEWGEHSFGPDGKDKFEGLRRVFQAHSGVQPPPEPPRIPRAAYGAVELPWQAALLDVVDLVGSSPVHASDPLPFEEIGADFGFVLYRAEGVVLGNGSEVAVAIAELRDRAHVFFERTLLGVQMRGQVDAHGSRLRVPAALRGKAGVLEVLVENMGRVNYGPFLTDRKGVTRSVSLDGRRVRGGWRMTPIPLRHLPLQLGPRMAASRGAAAAAGPAFFRGDMHVAPGGVRDTFLSTRGWGKGYVWVNGKNLGMYWESAGPQHALFVPACFLRDGRNAITVLELDVAGAVADPHLVSTATPGFGATRPVV